MNYLSTKPKSQNLYAGQSLAASLDQMAARIEKFPQDTHFVSLNGDELKITPDLIPEFVQFLRSESTRNRRVSSP